MKLPRNSRDIIHPPTLRAKLCQAVNNCAGNFTKNMMKRGTSNPFSPSLDAHDFLMVKPCLSRTRQILKIIFYRRTVSQ